MYALAPTYETLLEVQPRPRAQSNVLGGDPLERPAQVRETDEREWGAQYFLDGRGQGVGRRALLCNSSISKVKLQVILENCTSSAPLFGPINLTGVSSKVYSVIGNAGNFHRSSEQILRRYVSTVAPVHTGAG